MDVSHVLARKNRGGVESIGAQETIRELIVRLKEKSVGALVVTNGDGNLIGVISERDVVRGLAEDGDACLNSPVAHYMTSDVVTATPKDDAVNVLERMTRGRFRHMPVLEEGEIVGVVSIGDVVKARIEALQRDNQALEEFIRR